MEAAQLDNELGTYTNNILKTFAESYHLRIKKDECDDLIIPGSIGHIYVYNGSELGVLVLPPTYKPRLYSAMKKKCLSVGMTLRQDGDGEGAFTFNPKNKAHARMAIKVAQVRPKKQISDAHKAKLLEGLQKAKIPGSEAIQEGGFTC